MSGGAVHAGMENAPNDDAANSRPPARTLVVLGFATIYIVWGSTYLGIRWAVETIPPFLMGGSRFLVGGLLLHLFLRVRGRPAPTWVEVREGMIVGALLLLGGNGLVNWSEQYLPSGLTALIIGCTPLIFVLLEWLLPPHRRPGVGTACGLALGTGGIALLQWPGAGENGGFRLGALVAILVASVSWGLGSLYSKRSRRGDDPFMAASVQMMAGGVMQLLTGTAAGEWSRFVLEAVTLRSVLAWVYLVVAGSLLAFGTYIWLLRASTPARVATYAYVNPVIAVLLGWALADEAVTLPMLGAAAVIVTAVVLITRQRK
jgi:drug/metabolite transporter (DMT)-like permease